MRNSLENLEMSKMSNKCIEPAGAELGQAKWPTRGNQLYRLYFCILSNKTISRKSKDTRADLHRVRD